jgi:hypothetical protein
LPGSQGQTGSQGADGKQGATGNKGPQGDKGPAGDGGDKYAIVSVHNDTRQMHVGLFCAEMPEARFFDVYDIVNNHGDTHILCPIDPIFTDVCVPGSLVPIAVAPNKSCNVGVMVDNGRIRLDLDDCKFGVPTRVIVTISGVRRGRQDKRFPTFTPEAAEQNQAFWDQAVKPGS